MRKKHKIIITTFVAAVGIGIGATMIKTFAKEPLNNESIKMSDYETNKLKTYIGYGYDVVKSGYFNPMDVVEHRESDGINKRVITENVFRLEDEGDKPGIESTYIKTSTLNEKPSQLELQGHNQRDYLSSRADKSAYNEVDDMVNNILYKDNILDKSLYDVAGLFLSDLPKVSVNYNKGHWFTRETHEKEEYKSVGIEKNYAEAYWLLRDTKYYDYFTDSFKEDIIELDGYQLIKKYGTHILVGVELGGRYRASYELRAKTDEIKNKYVKEISGCFNGLLQCLINLVSGKPPVSFKVPGVTESKSTNPITVKEDVNVSYSLHQQIQERNSDCHILYNIECSGGDISNICYRPIEEIGSDEWNNEISEWKNSIEEFPSLIDVKKDGLLPIWDLVKCFKGKEVTYKGKKIIYNDRDIVKRQAQIKEGLKKYLIEAYQEKLEERINGYTEVSSEPIAIRTGKEFNLNYEEEVKIQNLHSGYDIGKVTLTNVIDEGNNTYQLLPNKTLKIGFELKSDINNLPLGTSTLKGKHYVVESDNLYGTGHIYFGKFKELGIIGDRLDSLLNNNVGVGGAVVRIYYNDGNDMYAETCRDVIKKCSEKKGDSSITTNYVLFDADELFKKGCDPESITKVEVDLLYTTQVELEEDNITRKKPTLQKQDWLAQYRFNFHRGN